MQRRMRGCGRHIQWLRAGGEPQRALSRIWHGYAICIRRQGQGVNPFGRATSVGRLAALIGRAFRHRRPMPPALSERKSDSD